MICCASPSFRSLSFQFNFVISFFAYYLENYCLIPTYCHFLKSLFLIFTSLWYENILCIISAIEFIDICFLTYGIPRGLLHVHLKKNIILLLMVAWRKEYPVDGWLVYLVYSFTQVFSFIVVLSWPYPWLKMCYWSLQLLLLNFLFLPSVLSFYVLYFTYCILLLGALMFIIVIPSCWIEICYYKTIIILFFPLVTF